MESPSPWKLRTSAALLSSHNTVHLPEDLAQVSPSHDHDAAQAVSDGLRDAKAANTRRVYQTAWHLFMRVDPPHWPSINARRNPHRDDSCGTFSRMTPPPPSLFGLTAETLPRPPGRRRQGHGHHRYTRGRPELRTFFAYLSNRSIC